jgi:Flp pilus assembly protein TadD
MIARKMFVFLRVRLIMVKVSSNFGRHMRLASLLVAAGLSLSACQTKNAKLDGADPISTASIGAPSFTKTKEMGDKWKKNPSNTELGWAYSESLGKLGQSEEQLAVLQMLAAQNPENAALQGQVGKKLLGAGKTSEALGMLDRSVALGNNDWKTLSALGSAYDQQGKYVQAREFYAKALVASPNQVSVMNNMGMSYALEGNLKSAETTLKAANALPGSAVMPRIRQNLALVVGLQGRFDESRTIASADLPPDQVEANLAYLQKMLSQPNTWAELSDGQQG